MPLQKVEDSGTSAEGSRSQDYCHFCCQNGEFTDPDLTLAQMIEKLAGFSGHMNMTQAEGREMARALLPQLKRWQGQ